MLCICGALISQLSLLCLVFALCCDIDGKFWSLLWDIAENCIADGSILNYKLNYNYTHSFPPNLWIFNPLEILQFPNSVLVFPDFSGKDFSSSPDCCGTSVSTESVRMSWQLTQALPCCSPGHHFSVFSALGFWFSRGVIRFYLLIRIPLFQWYFSLIFLVLVIHLNFWLCFYPLFPLSINAAFLSGC